MASPGNPNQQQQGPFDMNKFFKPTNIPHSQNPTNLATSPFSPASFAPSPSASYPPPAGTFSYPPQTGPAFYHNHYVQDQQPQLPQQQQQQQQQQAPNMAHQRSVSFPTPPLQPSPSPQNPNAGARLMALLSAPPSNFDYSHQPAAPLPAIQLSPSGSSEFHMLPNAATSPSVHPVHPINAAISHPTPMRMPSSKLPKGRHLAGDHVVYDVDVRLAGEIQPQLEVTPITKYVSDPGLILGHQISVNKTYICYGLKLGAIRVLNINTALRSLLRGHAQRVTDMSFFAEDVHLLSSASIDGRVYVWRISEGPDEEDKPQISGKVVVAIEITGEEAPVHPRVCWHCHKQEILVVAIGRTVLRIDTTRVGKGETFTAEQPLKCPLGKLIDGVQLVGKHDGEVTDLSMCQWMTTRLVSAAKDGTIKIWEDRKAQPLMVMRPHDGQPVDAAIFLTAPQRPDHIILITAGPQNREVKLWASSSEEGWLLPSDAESWRCTQTLKLKSSSEQRNQETFFNQVVSLSQAGLLLLANAKKNAIYAVHLDYGANPLATQMNYLAEFTVTMPILSFTGTSDLLPHGEHVVQVYCVQTQAIQQYALELSQCLPPPVDNSILEKSDSVVSRDAGEDVPLESTGSNTFDISSATSASMMGNQANTPGSTSDIKCPVNTASDGEILHDISSSGIESYPSSTMHADVDCVPSVPSVPSPSLPLSPRLSHKLSDLHADQVVTDYSIDRQMDGSQIKPVGPTTPSDDNRAALGNSSDVVNQPVTYKHPTHLITPSEIMATSSETSRAAESKGDDGKIHDVVVHTDTENVELEVKVVGETGLGQHAGSSSHADSQTVERKEKTFCSQASDLGAVVSRECSALPTENSIMEEAQSSITEALAQPSNSGEEDTDDRENDNSENSTDFAVSAATQQSPVPNSKGKRQKGKSSQAVIPTQSCPDVVTAVNYSNEAGAAPSVVRLDATDPEVQFMKDMFYQVMNAQKETQKQMMAAAPITKEGRRLETALGRNMEKTVKANADALWARIQEESAKQEKLLRDRTQQITNQITNAFNKDLLPILERTMKKEVAAASSTLARSITPVVEKAISSTIAESFQRGVSDKAVNQLERSVSSKLETTVARQIQLQFQASGKQALQDGLKYVLETSLIPAFELSCKAMFEQVDSAFQKGLVEHTTAVQHQLDSAHSPVAMALRETMNTASSVTKALSGELADGQRKLMALVAAGTNPNAVNPLVTQPSNGPLIGLHEKVEQAFDPTKELSRLISERKYEEAFTAALQRSDLSIVAWLCSQVDLHGLMSMVPLPLSQGVLLSLLQQLACDTSTDMGKKLGWMTDVAIVINPADPMIAAHARPIFEQVYSILNHHRTLPTTSAAELSSIRVFMHVINSLLMNCK